MTDNHIKEQNCICGTPENCKRRTDQVTDVSTENGGGCGCGGSC